MHNRSKDHCSPKYDVPLRQRQSPFQRYYRGCCTHYRGNTVNSKPMRYYREFQSHSCGITADTAVYTANTDTVSLFSDVCVRPRLTLRHFFDA